MYDASWTLLLANRAYNALMGDTTIWRGFERNAVWRNLAGPGSRVVHTPAEFALLQTRQVADLRLTAARYPTDRRLRGLIEELLAHSPRFVELWETAGPDAQSDPGRQKTIDHPEAGRITLDCDVLIVAGDDLRIMIYTAEPGTDDAERLDFVVVLGTQTLVD